MAISLIAFDTLDFRTLGYPQNGAPFSPPIVAGADLSPSGNAQAGCSRSRQKDLYGFRIRKRVPRRLQLVLLAGGWAHTRRAFYEALDHAPKEAGWILLQIGHLYEIERRLRRQRAGCALRDAYRSSQSRPICARIHRVLQRWSITRRFLPQSTMGKRHPLCLGTVGVAGGLSG